jgi:hypothetical protein
MVSKISPFIETVNSTPLTIEELCSANQSVGLAAEQDKTPPQDLAPGESIIRSFNAIRSAFLNNSEKVRSAMIRQYAIDNFIKKHRDSIQAHYQEEKEGKYCDISMPLMEAFATLPLTNEFEYEKEQVLSFLVGKDPDA